MIPCFLFCRHSEWANRSYDRVALPVGPEKSSVMNANLNAIIVKDLAAIYVMATIRLLMFCQQLLGVLESHRLYLEQQPDLATRTLRGQ